MASMKYIGTSRQRDIADKRSKLAAAAAQEKTIDQELDLIRAYLLEKSFQFDMLDKDPTSPMAWQLYSTYASGLPEGLVLSEENILDLIAYLVFLLAASRLEATTAHLEVVVGTKRPKPPKKVSVQRRQVGAKKKGARR